MDALDRKAVKARIRNRCSREGQDKMSREAQKVSFVPDSDKVMRMEPKATK